MTDTSNPVDLDDNGEVAPIILGPWALVWRKFRRHKLAYYSGIVVIAIYLMALFGDFLAPMEVNTNSKRHTFAPPQPIALFVTDANGERHFQIHVKDLKMKLDREAMRRTYEPHPTKITKLGFFVRGYDYKILGLIPSNVHFFGPVNPRDKVFILGADRLGRDIMSRIIIGTKVSMSIGLVGVAISLVIGIALGGLSGYYGGWIDSLIQRLIEFIRSIPTIPLWMGLAAAIPLDWPPLRTYFVVTVIVSMIGWTSLAREVRGKFLSLRNEDFIVAARLDGLTDWQVIMKHMVPSFSSHIIASLTLAVPLMILAETSLSFLGIGLQPPSVSWGTLLKEAQNIRSISEAPWLLIAPASMIVVAVLSLNFLGDGLRDAADPHSH